MDKNAERYIAIITFTMLAYIVVAFVIGIIWTVVQVFVHPWLFYPALAFVFAAAIGGLLIRSQREPRLCDECGGELREFVHWDNRYGCPNKDCVDHVDAEYV